MTVILPQSAMTGPIFLRGFETRSQKANPCQIATWSIISAIICGYSRPLRLTIDLLADGLSIIDLLGATPLEYHFERSSTI